MNLFDRLAKSLRASVGDIVFGMEDGTVSVFGLVFGVALSANNGQVVLLAGARARRGSGFHDGGQLP